MSTVDHLSKKQYCSGNNSSGESENKMLKIIENMIRIWLYSSYLVSIETDKCTDYKFWTALECSGTSHHSFKISHSIFFNNI